MAPKYTIIKKQQKPNEILRYYNKLKEYTNKLNELIGDFEEKFVSCLRKEKGKMPFRIRRPNSTDLTWDEKNPAVYVSKPLDVSALKKFIEEEKRKLNNSGRQQKLENSTENK